MKQIILFILVFIAGIANAQSKLHSHNDYEQERPFFLAYENEFESIEADIFLVDGELYVAHDREDIRPERTLKNLYLNPICEIMGKQDNQIYASGKPLQLLIDLKTGYKETLPVLEKQLLETAAYFDLKQNPSGVKIVISGSIPPAAEFKNYADIIFFDGRPTLKYNAAELKRIGMISDDYKNFASWDGTGSLTESEKKNIKNFVLLAHQSGVPARFWGCPDNPNAWKTYLDLNFDFINTDKIQDLRSFIDQK